LASQNESINAVVIGASGGIGTALVSALSKRPNAGRIYAASRNPHEDARQNVIPVQLDLENESTIECAANQAAEDGPLHLVIVSTGILHDSTVHPEITPEKSWSALNADQLMRVFAINTIGPSLAAKHFLPLLDRDRRSVFAALSARVGSISDNRLGGWYGYRASKSALNMIIRTLAIELSRRNRNAICIGLHPGTVDSKLSAPFQSNVADDKLFAPAFAATRLLEVVDQVTPEQSGRLLAWNGLEIPA